MSKSDSALADLSNPKGLVADTIIAIPSWQGGVEPQTQVCIDQLITHNIRAGNLIQLRKVFGSSIADNRNILAKILLDSKVKRILYIDTDMVFPPDAIQRMKKHDKLIVSGLAHSKRAPYAPNMYRKHGYTKWEPIGEWKEGELLKVDCIGGAFMLIKREVFEKVQAPWFASPGVIDHFILKVLKRGLDGILAWDRVERICGDIRKEFDEGTTERYVLGEDYYFSDMCHWNNIPIYVDTAMQIGHVGKYTFDFQDFKAQKDISEPEGVAV